MSTLGILTDNKASEDELIELFQPQKFELINVKEKRECNQLDGLVIKLTEENSLTEVIDWLLFSKSIPEVFVWVLIKDSLKREQHILLELGANDVITDQENLLKLPHIVKNIFTKINTSENKNAMPTLVEDRLFLNEKNQTVWVNQHEKSLTRTEYQFLKVLYEKMNTTVPYEELFEKVWKDSCENKLFRVANVVFHLREKVKESKQYEIKTTRSKGYMLKEKN